MVTKRENPRRYYIVACPYCGAGVGKACFQKTAPDRWYPPHGARVRVAEEQPGFRHIKERGTDGTADLGTYEYAGFSYRVTRIVPRPGSSPYLFLQAEKGQHPAASKDKHLQAALQCYLEDRARERL